MAEHATIGGICALIYLSVIIGLIWWLITRGEDKHRRRTHRHLNHWPPDRTRYARTPATPDRDAETDEELLEAMRPYRDRANRLIEREEKTHD